MKIALFGGSFDPFHRSHLEIITWCKEKLNFDQIWIIIAFQNPFKEKTYSSTNQRIDVVNLAIKEIDFVNIIDYEIKQKKPTPTYKTVKYLKEKFPENEFSFILGMDVLKDVEKWNKFDELRNMVDFKVFCRDGYNYDDIIKKYNWEKINFKNSELNSTSLRDFNNIDKQLKEINDYVKNNFLYIEEKIDQIILKKYKNIKNEILSNFNSKIYDDQKNYLIKKNVLLLIFLTYQYDNNEINDYLQKENIDVKEKECKRFAVAYDLSNKIIDEKNDYNQSIIANLFNLFKKQLNNQFLLNTFEIFNIYNKE